MRAPHRLVPTVSTGALGLMLFGLMLLGTGCETKEDAERRLMARSTGKTGAGGASTAAGGNTGDGGSATATSGTSSGGFGDGVVTGRVVIDATKMPAARDMTRDIRAKPECVTAREKNSLPTIVDEMLLVDGKGGIADCIVYLKGPGKYSLDDFVAYGRPKVIELDQRGCQYIPHVFGSHPAQTVRVKNSDPFLHNVQNVSLSNFNETFNAVGARDYPAMFSKSKSAGQKTFTCSVHTWMAAHAFVISHPFFDKTVNDPKSEKSGAFEIRKIPDGTYKVLVWHENAGKKIKFSKRDVAKSVAEIVVKDGKAEPAELTITISSKY